MRKGLLLAASTLLIMTGCSGFGNSPLSGTGAGPSAAQAIHTGRIVAPNALARKLIAKMPPLRPWRVAPDPTQWNTRPDETPQLNHILRPGVKGPRVPLFETHYWEGIFTNTSPPPPQQSGIKSLMSVYSDYYVPPGYTYFAPDMNGVGNDCLETYIAYNNSSAPAFSVTNWCGGSGLSKTINDAFVDKYVTTYDGIPVVLAASTTDGTGSAPTWHVKLYNYSTSAWDDLVDQAGASGGGSGFSMFEAYRETAGCPLVPTILAANIKIYNAATGNYVDLTPSNSAPNPEGACFTNESGYNFDIVDPNYTWEVTGGTSS
jgi:hypothetical protein